MWTSRMIRIEMMKSVHQNCTPAFMADGVNWWHAVQSLVKEGYLRGRPGNYRLTNNGRKYVTQLMKKGFIGNMPTPVLKVAQIED